MAFRAYKDVQRQIADTQALLNNGAEPDMRELAQEELNELRLRQDTLEGRLKLLLLPRDPNDDKNVIFELRQGEGGDEAALFAADLFRMYTRYAERQRWNVEVVSASENGIGGYKEIVFEMRGKGAYSRLKYEGGVHRVQRVPATEARGRIHTSTATVAVLPEVEDTRCRAARARTTGSMCTGPAATAARASTPPTRRCGSSTRAARPTRSS